MSDDPIRYEAEITGDCAPFRWSVYRLGGGYSSRALVQGVKGEADSFEGACFEALEAAKDAEARRTHAMTHQTIELFTVDEDVIESTSGLSNVEHSADAP